MHFSIIYSNSKNIDPKFESSFANKLSLQSSLWACNAGFLAREAKALKVLFFSSNFFSNFANFLYFLIFNNFKLLSVIFFNLQQICQPYRLFKRFISSQSESFKCTFFFFFQPLLKFLLIFSIFFFLFSPIFKLFSMIF